VNAKLTHGYDLSKVCVAKYAALRVAFWIGAVGVASALLFMMFSVPTSQVQGRQQDPTTSSEPAPNQTK
jgi:hypothetical protein